MILFWLICAGLVAIGLALILPTLLQHGVQENVETDRKEANVDVYRDQLSELEADLRNGIIGTEQYQQDRDQIERRLLDDVARQAPVVVPQANGEMTQEGIAANVEKLAKRLEQNPDDAEGWTMLARSYLNLEKYSEASNAYAKATSMKSGDADLWTEYAFVTAMTNGRQLEGQPREFIKKALQIDPENAKALELAGSAEFQAKNYQAAIDYWQRLLKKVSGESELTRTLTDRINEAKSLAGASAK
jgi:cytochrome c-type biogenesis protein CcmH